jgi:protein gp37
MTDYTKGWNATSGASKTISLPSRWEYSVVAYLDSSQDLFSKEVSISFIRTVFERMNRCSNHTFIVQTENDTILKKFDSKLHWSENIWIGVPVGINDSESKINNLVSIKAKNRFLIIEPPLIDFKLDGIDWVVVSGESCTEENPLTVEWVRAIKAKCEKANVPFYFKQWDNIKWNPNPDDPTMNGLHTYYAKGGCQLDGKLYLTNDRIPKFKTPTIKLFGKDYYVMDDMFSVATIWELKSYLPMSKGNQYAELKEDIKNYGIRDAILVWETPEGDQLVVEGHTRVRIQRALGYISIEHKRIYEDFKSIDEIKLWMVRHQLQRRNLSNTERVMYAYLSKDTIQEQAKKNLSKAGKGEGVESIDTYEEIAKLAGVGRTTVVRYNDVITKGSKTTIKKLHDGKLSISSAHSKIKTDPDIREKQPPPTSNEPAILVFDNIQDGIKAFEQGEIEDFLITRFDKASQILKKKVGRKIGIFIQPT